MAKKVLVFLEQRNGSIKNAALQVVKFGAEVASALGMEAEAVTIGNNIDGLSKVGGFGINKVTHYKNELLENYSSSAYSKIVSDFANELGAEIIVISNTALGKDIAPRIAVKTGSAIAVDVVDYKVEGSEIIFTRPVYAGKALTAVKLKPEKKVITIRPNVFNAGEPGSDSAEVVTKEAGELDLREKVIEIKKSEGKLDVAEADKIVSGGRGLKGPENFHLIEELADVIGAAHGASRAVVDAGWRPHSEQVGQTGKTVSPNLYIAVGISGAIQHIAGMRSSKFIVAINKDKDAPIFQIADYGIAGDAFEILPPLISELKRLKEN
ncbi:MAG: electron transfer flavoprotein subunit alpha/FixB family protein [Melioribacteraceae bacterium]|nr:electron transfer flavoprotein subunit alpha/FixB family protein [Melioribacteraceae bacterium]